MLHTRTTHRASGLAIYQPFSAEKLVPTLQAARRAGVTRVACIEDRMSTRDMLDIRRRALGDDRMEILHLPSAAVRSSARLPDLFSCDRWGVFAAHEVAVEPAALLARRLVAIGGAAHTAVHSDRVAQLLRHKDAYRNFVNTHVAPQCADLLAIWSCTFCVPDLSIARLRAAGAPDRVVIKPRNSSGSKGVELIDLTAPDAAARLGAMQNILDFVSHHPTAADLDHNVVQVEAFVDGEEYSVEGYFSEGRTRVGAVHWKPDIYRDSDETGQFVEGRFMSMPPQHHVYQQLARATDAILRAMSGLGDTVFHAEFRVDAASGKVFPIEIAGRVGGGSLSESSQLVSGLDIYETGVRLAMGLPATEPTGPHHMTSEAVIAPYHDGVLERFSFQLPDGDAMEVTDDNADAIKTALNAWLRRVPRGPSAVEYTRFPQEVPFASPLRHDLQSAFRTDGTGLNAVVQAVSVWSQPGATIYGFAGAHLGGLLIASPSQATDGLADLADTNAAMSLCLSAFHSEIRPF